MRSCFVTGLTSYRSMKDSADALRSATKSLGLSLGDRARLAQRVGLPVLTADRTWAKVAVGVEVKVVR
jgi:ribonuclease VapC